MTRNDAQRLLDAIMLDLLSTNPELPTDTVRRLFEAGELRVGLEILCDNLVEAGIALNNRAKTDIESVGLFFGMPTDYWRDIVTTQPTPLLHSAPATPAPPRVGYVRACRTREALKPRGCPGMLTR